MNNILKFLKLFGGGVAAVFTYFFGGADVLIQILLALVLIDYISGILGAIYNGTLSSEVGYKGIIKKVCIFVIVAVANLISKYTGIDEIRAFTIGFYIANEGISVLENMGKIIPMPKKLIEILEQLQDKDK